MLRTFGEAGCDVQRVDDMGCSRYSARREALGDETRVWVTARPGLQGQMPHLRPSACHLPDIYRLVLTAEKPKESLGESAPVIESRWDYFQENQVLGS